MKTKLSPSELRRHRRQAAGLKRALRNVRSELARLNHTVGARAAMKPVDLECLDVIGIHGPLTPSVLARQAGVHPATLTGVLDRLERDRWIVRERDADGDRRTVRVRARRDTMGALFGHFAGMNAAMDDICRRYSTVELELITGFLAEVEAAGRVAADELQARRA